MLSARSTPNEGGANGNSTAPVAPITLGTAHLLTVYIALSFVGSLYASQRTRLALGGGPASSRSRDHPAVIRARLITISCVTLLSCVLVGWIGSRAYPSMTAQQSTSTLLGLYPPTQLRTFFITPILYTGPLYARYLAKGWPGQTNWAFDRDIRPLFRGWLALRNYWVAPLTEELAFRSCVLAVYRLADSYPGRGKLALLTPLAFGVAHVHHAYETWHTGGRTSAAARQAAIRTVFQLAYTTLFGAHCAFLFLRTGSIWPALLSHTWCNIWGLPQLGLELQYFPRHKIGIWIAYLIGIAAYAYTMRNWTSPGESIFWPAP